MEVTKRPIWTLLALTLTCASVTQAVRISFLAIDPDGKEITDPQDCLQYFENVDLRSRMRNRIVMGRPESNIDAIKVKSSRFASRSDASFSPRMFPSESLSSCATTRGIAATCST